MKTRILCVCCQQRSGLRMYPDIGLICYSDECAEEARKRLAAQDLAKRADDNRTRMLGMARPLENPSEAI